MFLCIFIYIDGGWQDPVTYQINCHKTTVNLLLLTMLLFPSSFLRALVKFLLTLKNLYLSLYIQITRLKKKSFSMFVNLYKWIYLTMRTMHIAWNVCKIPLDFPKMIHHGIVRMGFPLSRC